MNFLRYVFIFLSLMLMSPVLSFAQEMVVDISVEGNRYIETPAIMAKIKSKTGQPLSKRQISKDVQKLFSTGYFSDVYTEGERVSGGIKLIFVVVENPVIASLSIEGNEQVPDKKLKPGLKLKPGFILSPRSERLDTNRIRKVYLEKGYYQADVKIETSFLDDGRVDVVIRIEEGEITFIKEIRMIGNTAFSDDDLIQSLASSESNFGSWFTDRDVFNRDRFDADAQLIQQFYQDNGYLDARVESVRLMLSPDKKNFYLGLSIYEGDYYTIEAIELSGDIIPSHKELMDKVKMEVGNMYSVSKLRQTIAALTERVGDEGFAFANVTPSFHRNIEKNTLVVAFDIEKGREVYVERVEIYGHTKTKDHVIRRELRQNEGERYSASNVRRSKERLGRLSYVEKPRISTPKGDAPDKINLKLDVDEGKSGTFSAGITYSKLNDLAFTGKVEEQNLFGEGYRANISADVGGATTNYTVGFVNPYMFSDDVSGSINLFRTQTDLQSFVQYQQDSRGGSAGLGLALSEYNSYSAVFSYTETTLWDIPSTASYGLRSQEGKNVTGEIKQTLSRDTRDRVMAATEGSLHSLSFGYAGLIGDHKFMEFGLSSVNYQPLTDFWTLKTSFNAGTIRGYGGVEPPVYRRYSLGGTGSLRGYDYYGVSLVDPATLDVQGGEHKVTGSVDIIFPLPYMDKAGFRGAFFMDTGTVWGKSESVTESFDATKLRVSYGFAIEWASPVGPISMNWANQFNAQVNDQTQSFEFALGRGF